MTDLESKKKNVKRLLFPVISVITTNNKEAYKFFQELRWSIKINRRENRVVSSYFFKIYLGYSVRSTAYIEKLLDK